MPRVYIENYKSSSKTNTFVRLNCKNGVLKLFKNAPSYFQKPR